jgi:hypothetical protein
MAFYDAAKRIVCNIIAVALAMTVSAVEALLPTRPEWLERVDELSMQLRVIDEKDRQQANQALPSEAGAPVSDVTAETIAELQLEKATLSDSTERLLRAYNRLWQFVHAIRSDGLLLDDKFCDRVEREWSVTTLMSYVRSADRALQDKAGETLDSAATFLAAPGSEDHRSR